MEIKRRFMVLLPAVALVALVAASPASAHRPPPSPEVTELASFGSGLGSGSTVGPDGALYVTDGNAGSVLRVDPESGAVSTFADGLPPAGVGHRWGHGCRIHQAHRLRACHHGGW